MFISFDSLHMNSTWGATNKIAKVNITHRHLSLNLVKGFMFTYMYLKLVVALFSCNSWRMGFKAEYYS